MLDLKSFCKIETIGIDKTSIERYSFGREIRKWAGYPEKFPLRLNSHHGTYLWNIPHPDEYSSELPAMIVFNKRIEKAWKIITRKPCYSIPHPFLLFRNREKLKIDPLNQQGSIFYYSHSSKDIDFEHEPYELINELKALPKEFQPVRISLYYLDVINDKHLKFLENGFECFSAGSMYNLNFVNNFYKELIKAKYTLSNEIGSHTLYSLDLGIPFSLVGKSPHYEIPLELKKINEKLGRKLIIKEEIQTLLGKKLNYKIDKTLLSLVRNELGSNLISNKWKIRGILFFHTLQYFFNKRFKKFSNKASIWL